MSSRNVRQMYYSLPIVYEQPNKSPLTRTLAVERDGPAGTDQKLIGDDCCSWHGVHCSNTTTGHVIELDLPNCSLRGDQILNSSLLDLKYLTYLDLSFNNFHGPIPEFVGSLTFLSELDLSYNNFQGLIPQSLGNLKSLSTLDLTSNRLDDSIPSELGNLTKLTVLRIYSNQLIGCLPESICHLSELKELSVWNNKLSGNIPKCIGELSNLIVLELDSNYWDGFVSEHHFINLKRLKRFYISSKSNLVLNISSEWIPPFQLQTIWMNSLKVGPSFPRWLQTQNEIWYFVMQNSSLSIIPTNWLRNLISHASSVNLSDNDINGEQLSLNSTPRNDLERLSLSNNNLSGDFPVFICNLTSLRTLVLSRNNFSGKLPKCLGNLKYLTDLDVMENSLSGDIPVSLGSLGNLRYLNLNNNKFQGKLPLSFQNLSNLAILDAGKNHLSDTLPLWTREQLPSLTYLILRSNSFHGEIPTQLCHHSSIQVLNLAQNQITGSIPPCFGNFSSMITGVSTYRGWEVTIGEMLINSVKGCELQYTSNLKYLFSIDLSNNRISGEIPKELMDLHGLTNLNLTGNRLAGRIPENIGDLYKLESLDLSNNEFSGPIPQNLSELNSLGSLNLSFNDLSGRIPTGRHFQTLNDLSIYAGNKQLCGQTIFKPCPGDTEKHSLRNHSEVITDFHLDDEHIWFYAGIGPGVLVGFLGFCASLHFIKSWRYFYFHHVEKVFDKIVVTVALLQRKIINRFFMKL